MLTLQMKPQPHPTAINNSHLTRLKSRVFLLNKIYLKTFGNTIDIIKKYCNNIGER